MALVSTDRNGRHYIRIGDGYCCQISRSGSRQYVGYDMPGDMEPFSLLLAKALNGPSISRSFLIRGGHVETVIGDSSNFGYPVVFGFWFVVGLTLESKLKHPRQWLIRRPRTRR